MMRNFLAIKNSSFIHRSSLMVGNVMNAGIGFLSFSLLARGLSKDDFGVWVLYLTIFGFVEMLRAGFVYQALIKFMASCTSEAQEKRYLLGAWQISTWLTIGILVVLFLVKIFFISFFLSSFSSLLFNQYLVALCLMLPINMATMIFHSKQKFLKLWLLNFLQSFPFVVYLFFIKSIDLQMLVVVHTAIRGLIVIYIFIAEKNFLPVFLTIFRRPDRTESAVLELMNFSRFTVLSTIGTNLLKSVDIWFINYFGGASMVAIYQVPLKLVEAFEIPLRTWAMSAYPRFTMLVSQKKYDDFYKQFNKEIKIFILGILPFVGICFHFSEKLIYLYAGKGFADSIILLNLFLIYILLLPIDRYLGIALDSLNLPHINTFKVFFMLFINVLGDYLVLFNHLGLWAVVVVTLLNIIFGIFIGLFFMKRQFNEKLTLSIANIARL